MHKVWKWRIERKEGALKVAELKERARQRRREGGGDGGRNGSGN